MFWSSEDLVCRSKLVELNCSSERTLFQAFAQETDDFDQRNGHAMAVYRSVKGFSDTLGVNEIDPVEIPVEQIRAVARIPFYNSRYQA